MQFTGEQLSDQDLYKIWDAYDVNGDGKMDREELSFLMEDLCEVRYETACGGTHKCSGMLGPGAAGGRIRYLVPGSLLLPRPDVASHANRCAFNPPIFTGRHGGVLYENSKTALPNGHAGLLCCVL